MKVFTGIIRIGDDIEIKAYEVNYENGHFEKKLVTNFDKNNVNKYFVDKNDPVELICPDNINVVEGKERGLTR